MKTIVCTQPGTLEYAETAMPVRGAGETLLKIERVGICGTDLHAFEGTQPYFSYPRILGHELAATIVETNAVGFSSGELVTVIPYFHCGVCIACRNGKPNCCTSIKVCGVHIDGGMREYLVVPDYSLVHNNGLTADELALTEPLAIGAHAVRRAAIAKNEFVLIIGAGPIGLGAMQFAHIAGAHVIAMDINNDRLSFCKNQLQIAHTINPLELNAAEELGRITGGDMPLVVMDATGNLQAINNAFSLMAHGGKFILVGLQKADICFSHPEFHKREATLMSSRNATREDFDHVLSCMKKGLINPSLFITHRSRFDGMINEFENWLNPANKVIKAMVQFN